jgi:hypothetical protein
MGEGMQAPDGPAGEDDDGDGGEPVRGQGS